VGSVAERLGFALATGAPVVGLAGFDEDRERGFLRDVRGGHELKVQGLRSADYGVLMKRATIRD
jgi:hypothetical protein